MSSNRFALLIGVSQYGEGLDSLPGSLLDIAEMAKVLSDPERGDFQNVELLPDPVRSEMETKVGEFFEDGKPEDLLLLYFSGHGDLGNSFANQQLHLCAKNTYKKDKRLAEYTAMSADFLKRQMDTSRSKQIVVILDCCYSGAIAEMLKKGEGSISFDELIDSKDIKAPGRVVLASSSSAEVSYGMPDGLSLYTHYLIEGMRGAANSGQSDWILAHNLHEYAVSRFEIQYKGATQPKIIVAKDEGYNIPVAKAPRPDPKIIFRQTVDARYRKIAEKNLEFDGEIQPESLDRMHLEQRRISLGLSQEEAQQIEIDVKSPYPIRSRNRKEYRRAVEIAYRNGFPFNDDDRQLLDEIYKDLSLGREAAEKIEEIAIENLNQKDGRSLPPTPSQKIDSKDTTKTGKFETVRLEIRTGILGMGSKFITYSQSYETKYFEESLNINNNVSLSMILIQGGKFWMGSNEMEEGSSSDEYPRHEVKVASFWLSKFQVTQQQWREIAALPRINCDLDLEPTCFKANGNYPIEQVSWLEAVEFCDRLSNYTQKTYRLPSEAEWEYACRAGTETPFYFGETIDAKLANYDATSTYGKGQKGENRKQTTPVNNFPPNAFGLHDMHGNVWEWCLDHWHDTYQGALGDGSAWCSSDINEDHPRLLRGGSWNYNAVFCRSAQRNGSPPSERKDNIGFRVVCVI